ncbi:hypothetical protein PPYR_03061 [Photinus pyralis]|uniref:EF-hand domain-containing protein n=2 Tax=Photinus pyralis TaxID=7054 RepID=A0A5N4A1T9_PHOPY|nr:rhomboid-related protein 2-like [Photinus pyralis]KAB0791261.1 hypothetical protein PPYR_03061 [Photinus pyralis]
MTAGRITKFLRENSVENPFRKAKMQWRCIFDKYDADRDGYISVKELDQLIESQDYERDIPSHVVRKIHALADKNHDGVLDFNEFVQMIQSSTLRPLFGNLMDSYVAMMVPQKSFQERQELTDKARYCPPPLGMVIISILEIVLYCCDKGLSRRPGGNGPISASLLYDPTRRYEAWRFVTYMLVHNGEFHLVVNLVVQLFLGITLEVVHRWWRVLLIYFAGVLAGSLVASICNPEVTLVGASGGVYAILTAHIASIIMNWKEMEYPFVQLLIFVIITVCDIGSAIYERHISPPSSSVSYTAHIAGAVAGLLMGINIVRNVKITHSENVIWWVSVILYVLLMGTTIVWHIAGGSYFPVQKD